MIYYYTPLFDGMTPAPDDGPPPRRVQDPGREVAGSVIFLEPIPSGIVQIHRDPSVPRAVVAIASEVDIGGWAKESKAAIDADYPGVFP